MPKESVSLQRFISYIAMQFTSIIQRLGKFIVNPEIKNKILQVMLGEPFLTQKEIADKVGVHKSTVSRAVAGTKKSNDYQLAKKAAGKFIEDFANTIEFWKLQITQLEQLKKTTQDTETISNIMREQSDRYEKILVLARQSEMIEALRKLNHGDVRPWLKRS